MRLSIKTILVLAMTGLTAVTVAIIQFTSYFAAEGVLVRQMRQIVAEDAEQAAQRTSDFLAPAESAAQVGADLISASILSIDDPGGLETHFKSVLDQHDQIDGMFFGTADGSFVYVNRDTSRAPSETRTKIIDTSGERVTTLVWRDAGGGELTRELDPTDSYDPRARPWYGIAIERGTGAWTDPYVFFTSAAPGITTSTPVVVDGAVTGVVGVDVRLEEISGFLADLKTSRNASASIMGMDLSVIAHPTADVINRDGDDLRFVTLDELQDPLSAAAYEALEADRGSADITNSVPVVFDVDGERHHAVFAPLETVDVPWVISVQAPESDYLGEVSTGNRNALRLGLLFGLLASVIGFLIARGIGRPIGHIAEVGRAVASGREPPEFLDSRIPEIADMTDALRTGYEEMDRRVVARTEELENEIIERKQAEARALAASTAKTDFVTTVSHELRTPLTAIVGYASLLSDPETEMTASDQADHIHVIERSANHLLELINDLLDLAKIEAGELELAESRIELADVTDQVVDMVAGTASDQGVDVVSEVPDGIALRADERRIRQIILNLVGNSVKFTPGGGSVRISAEDGTDAVTLVVSDTGLGMTPEELAIARERFGQIRNPLTKPSDGTGLGLDLVDQLASLHDATFDLESEKGVGTVARVTFPAERRLESA